MIIAVTVCIALIITAAAVIITRLGARSYEPSHSWRPAPVPAPAAVAVPGPERPAAPCSPAEQTVLDLPPDLARRYVPSGSDPQERP